MILGTAIEPDIANEANDRRLATLKQNQPKDRGGHLSTTEEPNKSRDEVAKKVGLGSGRTYERAKHVIEAGLRT